MAEDIKYEQKPTREFDPLSRVSGTESQGTFTSYSASEVVKKQLKRLREYYTDFYSGQSVKVFINDVLLDAVAIAWNATQNKMPIFGYASKLFDAVAEGTFVINGELTVAFKDVASMFLIHQHIKNQTFDPEAYAKAIKRYRSLPSEGTMYRTGPGGVGRTPVIGYNLVYSDVGMDEYGNQIPERGKYTVMVSNNRIQDLFTSPTSFDELCDALENAIWGVSDYFKDQYKRPDELDSETVEDSYGIAFDKVGKGFNLLLQYGSQTNPESEHTVKTLNDVHILSSSQSIDPNSGFIIETYNFVARNMDEPLTGYKGFLPAVKTGSSGRAPIYIKHEIPLSELDHAERTFTGSSIVDLETRIKETINEISAEDQQAFKYTVTSEILKPNDWDTGTGNAVSRRDLITAFAGMIQNVIQGALGGFGSFHPTSSFSASAGSSFIIMVIIE